MASAEFKELEGWLEDQLFAPQKIRDTAARIESFTLQHILSVPRSPHQMMYLGIGGSQLVEGTVAVKLHLLWPTRFTNSDATDPEKPIQTLLRTFSYQVRQPLLPGPVVDLTILSPAMLAGLPFGVAFLKLCARERMTPLGVFDPKNL